MNIFIHGVFVFLTNTSYAADKKKQLFAIQFFLTVKKRKCVRWELLTRIYVRYKIEAS